MGWLQCFDYQHREDIELADQLTAAAIRELPTSLSCASPFN